MNGTVRVSNTMSPHRFSFHLIPTTCLLSFTAPREEKLSLLQASFLNAKLGIKTTGRAGKAMRCDATRPARRRSTCMQSKRNPLLGNKIMYLHVCIVAAGLGSQRKKGQPFFLQTTLCASLNLNCFCNNNTITRPCLRGALDSFVIVSLSIWRLNNVFLQDSGGKAS